MFTSEFCPDLISCDTIVHKKHCIFYVYHYSFVSSDVYFVSCFSRHSALPYFFSRTFSSISYSVDYINEIYPKLIDGVDYE